MSKTYSLSDGSFETVVYDGPVHNKNAAGKLAPIDTTLVTSSGAGFADETEAGPFRLRLPDSLADAPPCPVPGAAPGLQAPGGAAGA